MARRTWAGGALGALAALAGTLATPALAATQSGWGPTSTYLGRYHVHPVPLASTGAPTLGPQATASGIFGLALAATESIIASETHPSSGELTMFMRVVKKTEPPVPSGILDLHSASEDRVLYLTELSSKGQTREAKVNGGAFVGPVIGSFSAQAGDGKLSGTVTAEGLGTVKASFSRFSAETQP